MKPTKRLIKVEITYWDCGNLEHRHMTEDVAARCMQKNAGKTPMVRVTAAERQALHIEAMRRVLDGATWKAAGNAIGVSAERCRQAVHKLMRISLHPSRLSQPKPEHDHYDVCEARKHKGFWLGQADVLEREMHAPPLPRDAPCGPSVIQNRDTPITALELPVPINNCLFREGIETVFELAEKSEADLLKIPNLGRKRVNEIKEALRSYALREADA